MKKKQNFFFWRKQQKRGRTCATGGQLGALWLILDFFCLSRPVVSAKPKVHSRQPRINSFVEVAVDGLPSETKKTGKRIGSSELLWNEIIIL